MAVAEMAFRTLILLLAWTTSVLGAEWSYKGKHGPGHWAGVCNTGQAQSPIDFTEPEFVDLEPFSFTHYEREPLAVTLSNNGHSAKIEYSLNEAREPIIGGGGLPGTKFGFAQAHFHWGGGSDRGSEHTILGRSYPLELHLVHYNKKYDSLMDALPHWDGLAVLGVMFRLSDKPNPDIEDILEAASVIKTPGTSKSVPKIFPLNVYLPNNTDDFFRYNGSLTTPPCSESVTWTVFTEPLNISEKQLEQFRYLKDAEGFPMKDNFRPVQPINQRRILTTKVDYQGQEVAPKVLERARYDVYHEEPEEVDHFFLLIMSIIIFFMQCGFAFMEAGAVRSKNTVNILIKNWLDMCIGALVYWAVGFALTFGESRPGLARFMGTSYFFFFDMPAYKLSKWFFQFVFAATAATLVSGSLAERCNFYAYIVYSIMITGFIYPMIAHWTWHREGWLRIHGYHDFAGSGVVHLTGAVCALVGCILMGPRIGRFDKDGKPVPMPGHSVPLAALGGLILVFGFFACNGTKQGSISHPGDGVAIATSIVNTALGTSAAGLCTLIFCKTGIVPGTGHTYSFLLTMNGSLTGTVALCAGCNVYQSWAAVVVGACCGPLFLYSRYFLLNMTIDDPLDAIPVHGIGGLWGVIAVYIFKADGLIMTGSSEAAIGLAWNLIGLATIIVWTGVMCFVMFYILKKNQMLRVETEHEFKGMDLLKHGESAYPADAWVEAQYMKDGGVETSVPNGNDDAVEPPTKDNSRDGLPPNMKFSRAASYNNPHEMFPSASKLFSGMNSVAGNVTIQKKSPKNSRSISVTGANSLSTLGEEGTAEEKTSLK